MTLLVVHMKYTVYSQHVTRLVHWNDIVGSIHEIPDAYLYYCRQGMSYYSTHSSRLYFQTLIVSELIWFFSFMLNYLQFVSLTFMQFKVSWGWKMCSSLTVQPQLIPESLTWTLNLELGTWTHILVDIVIICIYNCQTRPQLLIIVLYKIQSCCIFSWNQI